MVLYVTYFTFQSTVMMFSIPLWSFQEFFVVVGNCGTVHDNFSTVPECCHGHLYCDTVIPDNIMCVGNCDTIHEIFSYLPEHCHGHM